MLGEEAYIELCEKRKKDIIVFATKESHCLGDLLIKYYSNELEANIKAVISNHDTLKNLVEKFEIPYHCISAEKFKARRAGKTSFRMFKRISI